MIRTSVLVSTLHVAFRQLTSLIIPAYDAGLWNYIFQPVAEQEGLLRLANFSQGDHWTRMAKNFLVQPTNELTVFGLVTSNGSNPNYALQRVLSEPRQMLFLWIVQSFLVLCVLTLSIATIAIPCCCWDERCACCGSLGCTNQNEPRRKTNSSLQPGYLDQSRPRLFSVGSVRAALHDPRATEVTNRADQESDRYAMSNPSTDLYVNDPTINLRYWSSSGGGRNPFTPPEELNEPHAYSLDSLNSSLPLGSEARLCPDRARERDLHKVPEHAAPDRTETSPVPVRPTRKSVKCIHYGLFSFNVVLVMVLILLYSVTFYSLDHVYQYTRPSVKPNASTMTLNQTVYAMLDGLVSFLFESVNQGELATGSTLQLLQNQVTDQLNVTAKRVIDQLLEAYKIAALFDSVDQLKPKVTDLMLATAYVQDNYERVNRDLSSYSGELGAYQDLAVRAFTDLCTDLTNDLQRATCLTHLSELNNLKFTFDPSKIHVQSSVTLNVLMQQFNFNLTSILAMFDTARSEINQLGEKVVQEIQSKFRLESLLGDFLSIWKQMNTSVVIPLEQKVQSTKYTMELYISLLSDVISIGAYFLLAVYLLALLAQICCLVFCFADTIDRRLLAASGIVSVNSYTRPTTIVTRTKPGTRTASPQQPVDFTEIRVSVQAFLQRMHLRLRAISFLCGLLSTLVCLVVIVAALLLPAMLLVQTEVCRNFEQQHNDDRPLDITDSILAKYMEYEWPNWLNNATLPQDLLDILTIGPPKNLTAVISSSCDPRLSGATSLGLLGKLGLNEGIDFQVLLASDRVQKIINDSETEFVKQILNINFTALIPKDLSSLYTMAYNMTTYLDSTLYQESYIQLSRPLLSVSNLTSFTENKLQFLRNLPNGVLVQTAVDAILLIQKSIETCDTVQANAKQLGQAFYNLTENQNLTQYLKVVFTNLNTMIAFVSDKQQLEPPIHSAYRTGIDLFLKNMNQILITYLSQYLNNLIPCGRLYQLYHLAVDLTCQPDGFPSAMGVLSVLVIIGGFVLALDLFVFVRFNSRHQVQSHQIEHHLNWAKLVKLTHNEWRKRK